MQCSAPESGRGPVVGLTLHDDTLRSIPLAGRSAGCRCLVGSAAAARAQQSGRPPAPRRAWLAGLQGIGCRDAPVLPARGRHHQGQDIHQRFGGSGVVQYLCENGRRISPSPFRVLLLWFGHEWTDLLLLLLVDVCIDGTVWSCSPSAPTYLALANDLAVLTAVRRPPARYCASATEHERVMLVWQVRAGAPGTPETWSHATRDQEGRPHKFERNGNALHYHS